MRAIGVDQDTVVIVTVVCIATQVTPLLDHQRGPAGFVGSALGEAQAAKTGADNDKIAGHLNTLVGPAHSPDPPEKPKIKHRKAK